ncbi:hypothetical protein PV08_08068 [Exophiala spinifera]|uniref:Capsule synthesis protein CapA domain-containing protein n=1 Tax=Exophiala spinifera TaxID=91928 RepID=A0A0D1YD46_9EURO|nr:uncharacterized protein PV08_08068 [Exophiala spinifera]KIW12881.1 hypothetical protein PV08_08068 [Exophiala spinifera]
MSAAAGCQDGPETRTFTILLIGDLMIGRLIDALLPTSIAREQPESCPEDAAQKVDEYILPRNPQLNSYHYLSPWGNAVDLIRSSDGVIVNLETALTTTTTPWPGKVFNYRSHPGNVRCLQELGLGDGSHRASVSLANNHTLDWCREGLLDTVQALHDAGVGFAGAGRTVEEAAQPGIVKLGKGSWTVKCWSFSDHPTDWRGEECFNLIDYTGTSREFMERQIKADDEIERYRHEGRSALKLVSMHWGPNYRWQPSQEIVATAHWLIDACDVDIVHGHSSHHIQGVEVYKGRLIVYGCGDFVDDYAVDPNWRNDLSAAWRVTVAEVADRLAVKTLEGFPNRIQNFQAHLLNARDDDHKWVGTKFRDLCATFHTVVDDELGPESQLVVAMEKQRRA